MSNINSRLQRHFACLLLLLFSASALAAGTTQVTLVKDIYPGSQHSNPHAFTVLNGAVYFGATDGDGVSGKSRAHIGHKPTGTRMRP